MTKSWEASVPTEQLDGVGRHRVRGVWEPSECVTPTQRQLLQLGQGGKHRRIGEEGVHGGPGISEHRQTPPPRVGLPEPLHDLDHEYRSHLVLILVPLPIPVRISEVNVHVDRLIPRTVETSFRSGDLASSKRKSDHDEIPECAGIECYRSPA